MTTIRVTPIGGEPVELPEETAAVGASRPFSAHGRLLGDPSGVLASVAILKFSDGSLEPRTVTRLAFICDEYEDAHVHIGDAWPLCEIETWRQRAERLERELATFQSRLMERGLRIARLPPEVDIEDPDPLI